MQIQKPRFNFLKIFLLAGLLFIEGLAISYAQDEALNRAQETEQVQENPSATEEHDTEDLEKLLKRYNTDSEKILEDSSKLHNIQEGETKSEVNDADIEEMRPSDVLGDASAKFQEKGKSARAQKAIGPLDQSFSHSVRLALSEVQKLSEKELLKRLDESTKDSWARPYMDEFPNIMLFAVKLIKDTESIPSLVKIAENKDRLIWFTGVMLSSIIFGFILKRIMHREGRSFLKAAFYYLIRMYIMLILRIGIIYYFFHEEFTPAARVFKKTFID